MIIRSIVHYILTVLILLTIGSCSRNNSSTLNLNFERINPRTNYPDPWIYDNNSNYKIILDPVICKDGSYAIKIENIKNDVANQMASSALLLMDYDHTFTSIELSGYIKTEGTNTDSSGFFISTDVESNYVFLKDKNLIGTHDWKEYSVELHLESETENIYLGAVLFGEGKIWMDDLTVKIDGKRIDHTTKQNYKANKKEIEWLKSHCVALETSQAENGFDDLQPLKQVIGNARIVALGENTHGSSEVFTMKHRLIEFLATEMDFTIFAIEANMPEAYRLNNYVLYDQGNPIALLEGMGYWTWNTREVFDMILWMKIFNQSGIGRIEFTGFDMQSSKIALENIEKFADTYDLTLLAKMDTIFSLSANNKRNAVPSRDMSDPYMLHDQCKSVLNYLRSNESSILSKINEDQYYWLIQNAAILVQNSNPRSKDYVFRDSCMAENINWILDNNPKEKIILWAHNGHINRKKGSLGSHLSEQYGEDYYNIGFASNSGTYTATKSGRLNSNNVLLEGKPGSFEFSFHRTEIPYFFFDFDQVKMNEPGSSWMTKKLDFRSIGAVALENQEFLPTRISEDFNAIIYIDSTHASHCYAIN